VSHPPNESTFKTDALTRDLPIETVRLCYAEAIRVAAGLRTQLMVEAFATVPREHYLGPGPWKLAVGTWQYSGSRGYITTADNDPRSLYHDVLVAIDAARQLNNGHPSSLASFIDSLELGRAEHVFHMGCGLGYYTAIIAHVVGSAGHVTAVEIDPELASRARANLAHLDNVTVIEADGLNYDPGAVDAIFINAGVTHPQLLWLDRLRIGGRLLIPMTCTMPSMGPAKGNLSTGSGRMLLVRRIPEKYEASFFSPVAIYSIPTCRDPNYNQALGQAFREMVMGKRSDVKVLRRDFHSADETCVFHGEGFCLSAGDGSS